MHSEREVRSKLRNVLFHFNREAAPQAGSAMAMGMRFIQKLDPNLGSRAIM